MVKIRKKSASDISSQAYRLSQQLLTQYAPRIGSDDFNRRNDRIWAIARAYRSNIQKSRAVRNIMGDVKRSLADRELRAEYEPVDRNVYMGQSKGSVVK